VNQVRFIEYYQLREAEINFDNYKEKIPEIANILLSHPEVVDEIKKIGSLKPSIIVRILNVMPGLAALLGRPLEEYLSKHPLKQEFDRQAKLADEASKKDNYLYHVTTYRRLNNIRREGLSTISGGGHFEGW
jgi:hypothetical protein